MHSTSHHERFFGSENGERIPVSDESSFYDDIDARNGWLEDDEQKQQHGNNGAAAAAVAENDNLCEPAAETSSNDPVDEFDPDLIPIPQQSEAIIKLLSMLLAASNLRLELLSLCSAFGLNALLGGESFVAMALECGVTKQRFSRKVLEVQAIFHLSPSRGQKSVAARESYRRTQLAVWQKRKTEFQALKSVF